MSTQQQGKSATPEEVWSIIKTLSAETRELSAESKKTG